MRLLPLKHAKDFPGGSGLGDPGTLSSIVPILLQFSRSPDLYPGKEGGENFGESYFTNMRH